MQRRENGMGTIYQRDNGTWVGRIKEKSKDGKIKYKRCPSAEMPKCSNIGNLLQKAADFSF